GDHAAHYNWCRSADARLVDSESKARTDRLNQCTGCGDYARAAQRQIQTASENGCLDAMTVVDTTQWGRGSDHFGFCMSGGAGWDKRIADEDRARRLQLVRCENCRLYEREALSIIRSASEDGKNACLARLTAERPDRWGTGTGHFMFCVNGADG